MQRWHLTLGLTTIAIGAALIAPRLSAMLADPAPIPPPTPLADPIPEAHAPPTSTGSLMLDAGLDRTAVLLNQTTERFLTVRVQAPEVEDTGARRPVDVAVVLDASGSMSARDKIGYAKRAAKLVASSMQSGDSYSLVAFSDDAQTVVPSTDVRDVARIERAVDRIFEGGGTNLYAGLDRGAREVRGALTGGDVGRVIVLSDGNANVGIVDGSTMARFAADLVSDGVTLSTIGLGLDYNEDLLSRLADMGGGSYDFVDDPRELEAVFADELERTASVVARNTAVRIELPKGIEPLEVIGWDAQRVDGGWRVFLGDVYAGENRKIVARVRVKGDQVGERSVATVRADYSDLLTGSPASSHADATVAVTADRTAVADSIDRARAIEANRAYGNWYLEMSTRAYEKGDRQTSRKLLGEGRAVLNDASRDLGAPVLADDVKALEFLGYVVEEHAPMSQEGKKLIKGNKERFRAISR